jgi:hypothetical protein
MPKTCKHDGCDYNVWGGGYCKIHQGYRPNKNKGNKPKKAPLKKVSDKRRAEEKEYSKKRKKHLEKHPNCVSCGGKADQIHHRMQIRYGRFLNDESQFLSMCASCHRFTHDNVEFSVKMGYLASKKEKAKYLKDRL